MRKELYINSKLVELDSSTNIDLQFKSFLFSGISEVTAPRSWTVSLPKSAANLALVEGASSGDADTDFPYNNYTVDYYQNGYHLINSGKAVLIKITDRIEFVFTFGKAYEAIKAMGETKLTQLTEEATDYLTWNRVSSFANMTAGFGWVNFYSFTNEDRTYDPVAGNVDVPFSVIHPTVTFNYIMTKIQELFAVSLVGISAFVGGCSFPLRELEGVSSLGRDENVLPNFTTVEDFYYLEFNVGTSDFFEEYENGTIQVIKVKDTILNPTEVDINLVLTLSSDAGVGNYIRLYLKSEDTSVAYIDFPRNPTTPLIYNISASKYFIGGKLQWLYFKSLNNITTKVASAELTLTPKVKQAFYEPEATGGYFPIIPNLPDMTCADFLFQAMQLAGVFPSISDDDPTTINFFSADVLYDNIGSAKDWSAKLVKKMQRRSELSDVAFKFGSYAKSNVLQYKKDETNLLNTSSSLAVDNDNLEKESTLVDLKFAAGKRFSVTDTVIDYPLYDIKIQSGTLVRNAKSQSNDVIAEIVNVGGINYLKFTDALLWSGASGLKATNYVGYQSLIEKPRYLREKFHLKPQDVANLDMEIPIYLEQYGKYYAIMQLQYKDNEFSECELLEIKNI